MIPTSLERLLGQRRTLLLQGPMGPFFERLGETLRAHGQQVWKVNFNAGDDWFHRGEGVIRFQQPMEAWPARLRELLAELRIDAIVLFGQSRRMHQAAIEVARAQGITVFVFEEGYVRPDYVTLEIGGVNAASPLPRDPAFYRALNPEPQPAPQPTGQTFGLVARAAMTYALARSLGHGRYPHYRHHRSIAPVREGLKWAHGAWRKWWYRFAERGMQDALAAPHNHKQFFLVPLQVYNDSQIRRHSRFKEVPAFIREVLGSFARHAAPDQLLVFKHHPLDRPYNDYTRLIAREAQALGVADRVQYIHDQHLPTLLKHAAGVVTVNSTTGLQALYHGTPVIALGECMWAIPGLVHPGPLDSFWRDPGPVDAELFQRYRSHLVRQTQLNASFYAAAPGLPSITETSRRRAASAEIPSAAAQAPSWSSPTGPTLK
jgi:capsular polysaccharide export protein